MNTPHTTPELLDRIWVAYIYHNKKRIHLGSFRELEAAAAVRKQAEQKLFTHHGIKEGS